MEEVTVHLVCPFAPTPQYPTGAVHCITDSAEVQNVYNPITGRLWMDLNLGASQVATSSTDSDSYGDLYQWGRLSDGHQCRTSGTTTTLSSSDVPGHNNFIINAPDPYDWRSPQNNNLWQGESGINNPCPDGYRIPTIDEWDAERLTWSQNTITGAYNSQLKLTTAGYKTSSGVVAEGVVGIYWSSTTSGTASKVIEINSTGVITSYSYGRRGGKSVRCIKNQ